MSGETEAIEYPPRPKFYANKVTRLLFKTAMANDLGSDVCYMITQIAHQEDAGRYAGPVTFWNEQLMGICGFKNVRALDRARSAAVKAGWLVYIHGGKGKVGKYFTLIPPKYVTYDDGAIDETNIQAELTPPQAVASDAATETPDNRQTNARQTPENSQRNVRETPEKCLTFLPNPSPIPLGGMYTGENPDSRFVPVKAIVINPAVTAIEINGELVEYHEHPWEWEQEFIRLWNRLPGIHQREGPLDSPLRSMLQSRLCDEGWFWKRAFTLFPTTADLNHTQNLTWFFGPRTVSSLLDGTYHTKTKAKGNKRDRQGADNSGSTYNPATAGTSVDGWATGGQ